MRLFVAVWPPDDTVHELESIARPGVEGVRWTTKDQWHVTLRFLGEVAEPSLVSERLRGARLRAATAGLGPAARGLGSGVLCLPVSGLESLAAAACEATSDIGRPVERRPFYGHLTLARANGGSGQRALRGLPAITLSREWRVDEVTVVASRLGRSGARYQVLERVPACG